MAGDLTAGAAQCLLAANQSSLNTSAEDQDHLFVSLSASWYRFLALITTVGLVVSFVSNVIIIYLFTRNPSNIIAANLSISDMLYCIQWPSVIYCCLTQSTWILEYDFVCKGLGFLTVSTALVSIVTVLAMAVERAIVVRYSLRAKNKITIRSAWILVLSIWILCLASCLPPLFAKFNRFTLDPSKTSCTLDYLTSHADYKLYILVLYIAYYVLPIMAISISYSVIIITFNKSSLNLKVAASDGGNENAEEPAFQLAQRRASLLLAKLEPPLGKLPTLARRAASLRKLRESITRKSARLPTPEPGQPVVGMIKSRTRSEVYRKRAASAGRLIGKRPGELNTYQSSSSLSLCSWQGSSSNPEQQLNCSRCTLAAQAANKQQSRLAGNKVGPAAPSSPGQIAIGAGGKFPSPFGSITQSEPAKFQRTLSNVSGQRKRNRWPGTGAALAKAGPLLVRYDGLKLASQASHQQQPPPPIASVTNWDTQAEKCNRARNALQLRLAKMSFYLILLWLVSWSPIAWLAMLNSIEKCRRASATAVFLAHTMTKLGPAFDVFIYGLTHPKLKSKFKLIIKRMFGLSGEC